LVLSAAAGAGDGAGVDATGEVATTGAGMGVAAATAMAVLVAPVTLGAPASAVALAVDGILAADLAALSGRGAEAGTSAAPLASGGNAPPGMATSARSGVLAREVAGAGAAPEAACAVPLGGASGPATGTRRRGALRAASSVAAASVRT
jgi:hypothetical protein